MKLIQNIYKFLQFIFEKLSFRTKPNQEIFYDIDSGHTEYEYVFMPINEQMDR